MKLIKPSLKYEESFLEALVELRKTSEDRFYKAIGNPATVREYIAIVTAHEGGENLPEGWVPSSRFWLIDGNEFIGEGNIRHNLTEQLRIVGGHIGYTIRPSKRKMGYGKKILELAFPKCRELGIFKALITCDETNIASKKIIEANGGLFENAKDVGEGRPRILSYWIKT